MTHEREFRGSPWEQGADEARAYKVDTATWPGTGNPTNVVCKLFNEAEQDVSATNLTGSASVSGTIITTPTVFGLTLGKQYRLEVKWDRGAGNTLEAFGGIVCR